MIVPRNRLLLWVGLLVVPFATVGALLPELRMLSLFVIGALVLVAVLDLALSYDTLHGLRVELPEVVHMSQDHEANIELRIQNPTARARLVRFGIPFPAELRAPAEDMLVDLPAGSEHARLAWPCRPLKRGRYTLHNCHLEAASRLGLWALRGVAPVRSELRVYPSLREDRKHLAALFLNRGNFGLHAQRQIGKGRDFEKLRDYIPGDSFEDVHWKATAKRGHPVTKVFQIERTQEVYVIIDSSRLSARPVSDSRLGTGDPTADQSRITHPEPRIPELERFLTAALVLGLAAEKQGDLFGVCAFSDRVRGFVRARNGKTHYDACRDALYTLEPQLVNPDFDEVCTFLRLRLRRRALLVFLTNLDDPVLAESFVRNMGLISRQHLILVNMLSPRGVQPLFHAPDVATTGDLYHRLSGHILWHNLRELQQVLHSHGVQFSLLAHERLSVELVTQYLNVKRRQIL